MPPVAAAIPFVIAAATATAAVAGAVGAVKSAASANKAASQAGQQQAGLASQAAGNTASMESAMIAERNAARQRQQNLAIGAGGRADTILTGPLGAAAIETGKKTLLGE